MVITWLHNKQVELLKRVRTPSGTSPSWAYNNTHQSFCFVGQIFYPFQHSSYHKGTARLCTHRSNTSCWHLRTRSREETLGRVLWLGGLVGGTTAEGLLKGASSKKRGWKVETWKQNYIISAYRIAHSRWKYTARSARLWDFPGAYIASSCWDSRNFAPLLNQGSDFMVINPIGIAEEYCAVKMVFRI